MEETPPGPTGRTEASRIGAKSSGEKRKPVRRDPEKRRQQNIQAQKKYREKLRKRLDNLEALAASVANSRATGVPVTTPDAVPTTASTDQQGSSGCAEQQDSCRFLYTNPSMFDSGSSDMVLSNIDMNQHAQTPALDIFRWDSNTYIDPSHLILDKYTGDVSPCWETGYIDCGCPIQHVRGRMSGPVGSKCYEIISIGPNFFSADPCMNSLRMERMCYIDAMWSNCLQIGISLETFCGEGSSSPFPRPIIRGIDDSANDKMVHTVQSIFKTLKPDLRPIREQITIRHPPYIDILPFPTLRKNLIVHQHEVDVEQMFHDALNGLICWGGTGVGRRDRDCSTGRTSSGAPWDCRSWEAKPWFIRKYWNLLGGEEGELVRQSEWWRTIRGEESEPFLGF
ncbi:hypothetical protein VP1G_05394 [Cytospora mali]|uniref:BZIP domain-containing protein n=1 Tax=Cytospora mali TaxID=578113 RepID=A0A194V2H1_CYTMA|nr:hypothetical protein VP1G_05394 [Valsa mali var. pyri (nom. inval.)]